MVRVYMRDMAREMLQPSLMSASPTLSHDIPCTQPSDHLFLAGTTESPSLFGRAPSPEKQLMVLPHFSPIFGLVALTALYFLAEYRSAAHGGVDVDSNGIGDGDC